LDSVETHSSPQQGKNLGYIFFPFLKIMFFFPFCWNFNLCSTLLSHFFYPPTFFFFFSLPFPYLSPLSITFPPLTLSPLL
jgi:hypothetical protein